MPPLKFSQAQEVFEIILNGLADGILVTDHSQRIAFANKALGKLFNLKREPVGRDLIEVVRNHRICEVVQRAIDSGKASREEIKITPNHSEAGRHIVLSVDAEPVPGELGGHFVRVILKDETQRVETEQVRRDFVANASHELRTPLSIINGYIENLSEGAIEDRTLALRFLGIMKKHGDRIARIVEDMLTISKFESATQKPSRSGVFDVQTCAADVIERLQPLIDEREACVRVVSSRNEALLAGDRFYWDQIFFNLIENALKQNRATGLTVTVSFAERDDGYRIIVADDGVGIPSSDLPFIFKRFYRVEKHHSQEIKGTGLGLSIVKRAVEAHGGTVAASSIPGKETAFIIEVPRGDISRGMDGALETPEGSSELNSEGSS